MALQYFMWAAEGESSGRQGNSWSILLLCISFVRSPSLVPTVTEPFEKKHRG
jgi:hypothetical protein